MSHLLPAVRVAVVGPESSGKSTLIAMLAEVLQAEGIALAVVAEHARAYYAERPYRPTPADVEAIARAQCRDEDEAAPGVRLLLCDSTALTCRIWAEDAFGEAGACIHALCGAYRYALTLLVRPDIPWTPDPLRSHPDARDALLAIYRQQLSAMPGRVLEIHGSRSERLACALAAIRPLLSG